MRGRSTIAGLALLAAAAGAARAQEADGTKPVPALSEPIFRLSVGRIVDPGDHDDDPLVLGSAGELDLPDQSLTETDRVYLPRTLAGTPAAPGDAVQFFRLGPSITDPWTNEPLGRLLRPTGVGIVDSLAGEVVRARIVRAFLPVLVGDHVRAVAATDTVMPVGPPAVGEVEGYVIAFQEEKAIHPPFDLLFLRLPRPDALPAGAPVLLFRDGPVVDGRRLPEIAIARGRIVRVHGTVAAAALVETMRSDLTAGDRFRHRPAPAP